MAWCCIDSHAIFNVLKKNIIWYDWIIDVLLTDTYYKQSEYIFPLNIINERVNAKSYHMITDQKL